LSKRVQDGAVIVLDDLRFDAPKTRDFKAFLGRFGIEDAVIVLGAPNDSVERSGRNIPGIRVMPPVGVNVYDVLLRSRLVMTRSAVEALTVRLGGE
jgi:large subunit ribosomal protein L4